MSAGFAVERSLLSSGTVRLNGNVGYEADGRHSGGGSANDLYQPFQRCFRAFGGDYGSPAEFA